MVMEMEMGQPTSKGIPRLSFLKISDEFLEEELNAIETIQT
jgi:hypothetical protein